MQVSPIKRRREGEMKVRFLSVIDGPHQTACKVALFNKDAEPEYKDGDIIKIMKVYGWKKRDCQSPPNSLGTNPTSEVEVCQFQHILLCHFGFFSSSCN